MARGNISVDTEIWEEAKRRLPNVSGEIEKFLKSKIKPEVQDLPKENVVVRCSKCGQETRHDCFLCRETNRVFCEKCEYGDVDGHQETRSPIFDQRCVNVQNKNRGVHFHFRVPGWDYSNENLEKEVEQIGRHQNTA